MTLVPWIGSPATHVSMTGHIGRLIVVVDRLVSLFREEYILGYRRCPGMGEMTGRYERVTGFDSSREGGFYLLFGAKPFGVSGTLAC